MKGTSRPSWLPITAALTAILACFVPAAAIRLQQEWLLVYLRDDYTGWVVLSIAAVYSLYAAIKTYLKQSPSVFANFMAGLYFSGNALFRGYQTFSLFNQTDSNSLAAGLQGKMVPREGLILLFAAGCILLYQAFAGWKMRYSTPKE